MIYTLSLITLIAIIQAYRSYPQLNKLAGYIVAPLISNEWYLKTPPGYKEWKAAQPEVLKIFEKEVAGTCRDWSLSNPKLGTVYGPSNPIPRKQ